LDLREKQQRLLDDLLAIPDPQERLAIVVARKSHLAAPDPADRTDANRVPGCVSTVWLTGAPDPATHRLRLRADAESPLVKGLVTLLCELYDDTAPADATTFQSELLEKLQIIQNLSPTRRNGLAAVQARIRALAAALATTCL
jgi:cysteine desulfuration protein SufE